MATHKTPGHICETCGKQGHTSAQCWTAHPELVPEGLQKKRQAAMTAANRQKRRATEYVSPGYKFQGNFMALTYKRPQAAMAHRRSARASRPTVTFQLVDPKGGGPRTTAGKIHNEACPLTTSNPSSSLPPLSPSPLKKAAGEERDYVAQLPQTFPHGLPPSSLEPGTTDQQYPPTSLFPEPPLGEGGDQANNTPFRQLIYNI